MFVYVIYMYRPTINSIIAKFWINILQDHYHGNMWK